MRGGCETGVVEVLYILLLLLLFFLAVEVKRGKMRDWLSYVTISIFFSFCKGKWKEQDETANFPFFKWFFLLGHPFSLCGERIKIQSRMCLQNDVYVRSKGIRCGNKENIDRRKYNARSLKGWTNPCNCMLKKALIKVYIKSCILNSIVKFA